MKYIGFCVALIATMSLYSMDNFQPRTNEGNIARATEVALNDKKQKDHAQFLEWINEPKWLRCVQKMMEGAQGRCDPIKQSKSSRSDPKG